VIICAPPAVGKGNYPAIGAHGSAGYDRRR